MAMYDTIRLPFVLTAQNSWHIHQLDVKSAFLNGFVHEKIYVEQPDGVVALGKEDYVYLLRKTLCGLKQTHRAWYETMDKHLTKLGFVRNNMLVIGNQPGLIQSFKDEMNKVFEMTDLRVTKYFLGMEVKDHLEWQVLSERYEPLQDASVINFVDYSLNQGAPAGHESAETPIGHESTPMTTSEKLSKDDCSEKIDEGLYRSLIGSLLYLTTSRPNILFVVSVLSRFMHSPSEKHFSATKRVLRYIKETVALRVQFSKSAKCDLKLLGYSNNDWEGCVDDSRSTSGYLFSLGLGFFTWSSKKQETTTQFIVEAEYIVVASAVNQVSILKNLMFHGRTKYIKIKYHFIREVQQSNEVLLVHCSSKNQLADIFTKPLPMEMFEALKQKIGVCHPDAKEKCSIVGIPDSKPRRLSLS
uniref:Reverse transcriptase Ty1/copia-type domain-containing protein n=1 Tax=Vitis vinifera TaxID=29760 RepID=A5ANY0_VITVI|nr:hypothetical protein VITISV_037362 [Vitis vinifera]